MKHHEQIHGENIDNKGTWAFWKRVCLKAKIEQTEERELFVSNNRTTILTSYQQKRLSSLIMKHPRKAFDFIHTFQTLPTEFVTGRIWNMKMKKKFWK